MASKYLPPQVWWTRRNGRDVQTPLTGGDTSNSELSPSWSSDARRIALAGRSTLGSGVYVAQRDTSRARLVAAGDVHAVAWSPDGGRIAYSNCRRLVCSVLVAPTTTAGMSGAYVARGRDPAWSRQGGTIAYVRLTRDLRPARIYLIRPNGTHARPLLSVGR